MIEMQKPTPFFEKSYPDVERGCASTFHGESSMLMMVREDLADKAGEHLVRRFGVFFVFFSAVPRTTCLLLSH